MSRADVRPPLRVLIVDDNQDAANSLAMLLELRPSTAGDSHASNRYEVRVAYDGTDGLRVAREFVPDCVVSDIRMPGLDGYQLARAIRGDPAFGGTKLIALSAFSDAEHERRVAEAGFDHQLTKAHELRELLEILKMMEEIKELTARTRGLVEQNVNLASQTKELLEDVKEDVTELKQDVAELKQDVAELKQDVAELKDHQIAKDDPPNGSSDTRPR